MTRTYLYLLLAIAAACRRSEATPPHDVQPDDEVWLSDAQMEAAGIRIAEAKLQPLAQVVSVGGRVAFDDLHVTHVFSPVTGRVMRVLAKPGQRVERGTPLLAILSPDVGTVVSDMVKAQADRRASELDFRREAGLLAADATSQRSYEAAQDAFRRATAEYERASQRAAMLHAGSAATTQEYVLRSYLAGEVIARNVNPGTEVAGQYAGGSAAELFTIGDIKKVSVYADVPDTELANFHVGDAVEVSVIAYPGRIFRGEVDLVASTVDPVLRTGRIRCSLPNDGEELKPEMFATVSRALPAAPRMAVPGGAVVAINETRYIYVASGTRPDGRQVFKRRQVTIGGEHDGVIAIDGIAAGERVVVEGSVSHEQPNDEVWPTPNQIDQGHITTARVEERDLANAVTIGGRLTFDDTKISHVFSPVNGRITKVLAQPGERVAKGAPLVVLVSPDVGNYMADVVKAEADRVQAEHEYQRQKELYDTGVGAKRDLELAENALAKANAELARARQLTELLAAADFDAVSQEYVLRSPIAGEVIARKANPGLEVQGQYANGGSSSNVIELFTIGEIDPLWVLGDVYEIDLPRIHEGDSVTIHVDGADKPLHGQVEWVADVLDPVQHTAKVRCVVANADRVLRPEMYERVQISVPGERLLVVPRSAVMRVDGETIAFVQTGERKPGGGVVFQRRRLTARLDDNAELVPVISGLRAGEMVAAEHSLMLLGML